MSIMNDLAATEKAYDPIKSRQMAKEAGVSKDLLKQLVLQKKARGEMAADRQGIMAAPLPQGTIADQNARKLAERTGQVLRQQEMQRQKNLQRMANMGVNGAPSPRAMPGGIADAARVRGMKQGGMVRGFQGGGSVAQSPDENAFLRAYQQYQRAMQMAGSDQERQRIRQNFERSTQNFSSDTKRRVFQYLDSQRPAPATPPTMPSAPAPTSNTPLSGLDRAMQMEGVVDPELRRLIRAIHQQESSGGRNTATSVDGARGAMQVTPIAFEDVNQDDLDPGNPQDWLRAGVRYAKKGWEATGGDPAMAAAYYHGGPSAPSLIQDTGRGRSDSLGMNTADYARSVAQRMDEVPRESASRPQGVESIPMPNLPAPRSRTQQPAIPEGIEEALPRRSTSFLRRVQNMIANPVDADEPEGEAIYQGPNAVTSQGPRTEVEGYNGPRPGEEGFEPIAGPEGGELGDRFIPGWSGPTRPETRAAAADPDTPWTEMLGRRVGDYVTYPFRNIKAIWDGAGDLPGPTVSEMGAGVANIGRGVVGLDALEPKQPTNEDTGYTAEQYMEATAGPKPTPTAPAPAAPPPVQQEQPKGIEDYFMDRVREQNDPQRRKMERLAAWASAQGGHRNVGEQGKSAVAASQAWDMADNAAIDQNLNAELNRRNELGMWEAREEGYKERAIIDAMSKAQQMQIEADAEMLEWAYKHVTEGPNQIQFMQAVDAALKDSGRRLDPRVQANITNTILSDMMVQAIEQRTGQGVEPLELESVEFVGE